MLQVSGSTLKMLDPMGLKAKIHKFNGLKLTFHHFHIIKYFQFHWIFSFIMHFSKIILGKIVLSIQVLLGLHFLIFSPFYMAYPLHLISMWCFSVLCSFRFVVLALCVDFFVLNSCVLFLNLYVFVILYLSLLGWRVKFYLMNQCVVLIYLVSFLLHCHYFFYL